MPAWPAPRPWHRLRPGGPPPPTRRNPSSVTVYHTATGRQVAWALPAGGLHVDPAFLAGAVRHYVAYPERRPAIGTDAELARLQTALTGGGTPRPGG